MQPSAIPSSANAAQLAPPPTGDPSEFGNYSDWAKEQMAQGFTADQLKQTLSESGVQVQPSAPATPPASGSQPSWWEKLLPTAGGVIGGILGLPGDFLGGAGSVIGASGGAAAGQAVENALTGKKVIQGNDLTSGIENGAGQAIGEGAAKVVGALGSGIVKAGSKAGEKAAADAEKVAGDTAAASDQKATELNFGGVSPEMQRVLHLGDNQDFLDSMGMDKTNPQDMQKASEAGLYLNNVYDRALSQAKPVDMSDAGKLLGASEGKAVTGLSPEEQAAARKAGVSPELMAKGTVQAGEGAPGTTSDVYEGIDSKSPVGQALAEFNKSQGLAPNAKLPDQMNPTEVRQLQQAVGRQIGNVQKYVNGAQLSGKYDAELVGQLGDLNNLYGALGTKIKTPEVDAAIGKLEVTPADRQGLIADYGQKLGGHIADTITNAKSADDLLQPMQQFKRMDDLSGMALDDITQARATPRATARQQFQTNGGIMPGSKAAGKTGLGDVIEGAAKTVHSPTGMVIAAGRKLHEAGLTPKIAKGVGNIIKRTAPMLKPSGVVASNIPNVAAASQPGGSAIPSTQGESAMQPGGVPSPVNSVIDTVLQSMQAPGASLTPGYGTMGAVANALAPPAQQNELAAGTAGALTPTFNNAGGPQGLGGGLVSQLLAKVPGTSQNTYTREQLAAATQLAQILHITPQAALAMLPQFTQSAPTAAPQQQAVGGLVGSLTAGQ